MKLKQERPGTSRPDEDGTGWIQGQLRTFEHEAENRRKQEREFKESLGNLLKADVTPKSTMHPLSSLGLDEYLPLDALTDGDLDDLDLLRHQRLTA